MSGATLPRMVGLIRDYDYELPNDRIAQTPLEDRSASKLLIDRGGRRGEHSTVARFADNLRPGDLVVINDTKVLPARIFATRPTGGRCEVLLLSPDGPAAVALRQSDSHWEGLVRPSRKIAPGTILTVPGETDLTIEVGEDLGEGRRRLVLRSDDLEAALDRVGQMPVPPYVNDVLDDASRYQTVYANEPGSAAAPTAGLHFTDELLKEVEAAGARVATVDLTIGLDTFRPVTVERLDDHQMHSERYCVSLETQALLEHANRVVAIGTTTVRALESSARLGPSGRTDLFIRDRFDFQVVDLMLTNFHMPKSTLLVMIQAFVGPRWRDLYSQALESDYRFLSFGDAMLLDRTVNS